MIIYLLFGEDHNGCVNSYRGVFSTLEQAQTAVPESTWTWVSDEDGWDGKADYFAYWIITDEVDHPR